MLTPSVVFFFSSRRRHTRLQGDWSSDVCSSDLLKMSMVIVLAYYAVRAVGGIDAMKQKLAVIDAARQTSQGGSGSILSFVPDRKSVRVGKECRSRWSPYH